MISPLKKIVFATLYSGAFLTTLNADEQIIKSIMDLRSSVETLYTQIDDNKEAYKTQMKSYALQISDNEAQINRQQTALKLSDQSLHKIELELQKIGSSTQDLTPLINHAITSLKAEIQASIPFKTTERLEALDQIQNDLKSKNITQEKALALVWASYDDTLRMTKEIGQFKQEIMLEGKAVMAKIAKIGSLMIFFATPDNRFGYVQKTPKGYEYFTTQDELEQAQIIALFDSLQKQIRTGYFTLPNRLILKGSN